MAKMGSDLFPRKPKYTPGLKPMDKLGWYALADDLIKWLNATDSLHIEEFPRLKGYSPYKFLKWFKNNENDYFTEKVEVALATIGMRREDASRDRSKDNDLLKRKLPLYDLRYADYLKELKEQRQLNLPSNTIMIVKEADLTCESSPLVPLLREGTD